MKAHGSPTALICGPPDRWGQTREALKRETSSPLELESWPQAEMVYCITFQSMWMWILSGSPKTINWTTCVNVRTHKETHKQELSNAAACVKLAMCTEDDKKVRQRAQNALRQDDWPLPLMQCADMQVPWSSPQLQMNMSLHRPTGRTVQSHPHLFHLPHIKPPPIATTNSYLPSLKKPLNLVLQAKMRGYVGAQRGESVALDQSHSLFVLTAGRTVTAVEVWVHVASSWLQAVR